MGRTILITGATGFIARHIALQLLQQGYRVRGTVRSAAKGEGLLATLAQAGADVSRLEVAEADLTRDAGLVLVRSDPLGVIGSVGARRVEVDGEMRKPEVHVPEGPLLRAQSHMLGKNDYRGTNGPLAVRAFAIYGCRLANNLCCKRSRCMSLS